MCLKWLIESFSVEAQDEEDLVLKQYLYAGGICLTTFVSVMSVHPSIFGFQHIGMKIRIASSSLIYRKVRQSVSLILNLNQFSSHFIIRL
jgi:hypothetical protein